jgi:sugar O-acyltransferase (sialic acid O-acetyltransferase NeuD family)
MSEPEPVFLIGGGGHAGVVADALLACPDRWKLEAVVDPASDDLARRLGVRAVRGDEEAWGAMKGGYCVLTVGVVGVSPVRERIVSAYDSHGARWAVIVHPSAVISPFAVIEPGAVVLAGAVVNAGARAGRHCIINTRAVVEHDVVLGSHVSVAPGAVIGGGARVGSGSFIGLGACVRDHVKLGDRVLVGMGAVVVGDSPPDAILTGNPARPRQRTVQ